jgi:translation initiation factor IF-3
MLVVKLQGKEGPRAKQLLEQLIQDLKAVGSPQTGIQLSGKQAVVQINSL